MNDTTKNQILKLIHQEVIPAIGCTEPIAVALAAAKAAELLGTKPEKIDVYLSANILKKAMALVFQEQEWLVCLLPLRWEY